MWILYTAAKRLLHIRRYKIKQLNITILVLLVICMTPLLMGTVSAGQVIEPSTAQTHAENTIRLNTDDTVPQPMAPSWPADSDWILIDTDDDVDCPNNPSGNVSYAYYRCDSEYLYLRLQTTGCPDFTPTKDNRYKWFIDVGVAPEEAIQGGKVVSSEYLLFLEDTYDNDTQYDLYLLSSPYPHWPPKTIPPTADSITAGYRITCPSTPGPGFVDLYVKLSAIGVSNCYQVSLIWVTDNEDPNLDAAPACDKQEPDTAIRLSGSITIVKDAVPNSADDFQFSGDLGSFILDDDSDPTYPNTRTFNNLVPRRYNVTENLPQGWNLSISGAPSTGNTANINLGPGGNITVTFTNTVIPTAPTVSAIEIYSDAACQHATSTITPQTTYYAKVTVNLASNLVNLQTVQVTLFHDINGNDPSAPGTSNTQTCAILTCTVGPPANWTIEPSNPPTNTTWGIVSTSCSQPANLNVTTGDWIFAFIPGKVAHEAPSNAISTDNWDAQGKAINKSSQSGELYVRNKAMNWYGEITIIPPLLVNWGEVPLGLTFENTTYNPQTVGIKYIANGDYYEDIESSATWTNGSETVTLDVAGNDPPAADMFALMADNTNVLNKNDAVVVIDTQYRHINAGGSLTGEDGVTGTTNSLWLSLGETGIAPVVYSGNIYYQIADR